jgi:hypothetical protein
VLTNVQFSDSLAPNASGSWFTYEWPVEWHVVWYLMPTSPKSGAPQIEWDVSVERTDATYSTYWINVKNLTGTAVDFEARYAILN